VSIRVRVMQLVLLLGASSLAVVSQPTAAAPQPAVSASPDAPLQQDPAIRSGRLSNGLSYFIQKTSNPPGTVSFRLRIGAGSLSETDAERGYAHLLEHLVMASTKNFPDGALVKQLEAAGLRLGPDTNAVTDFNQTLFKIDAPKSDPATIDLAMRALADIAMNADLSAKALEQERAVVLAEERSRANPQLLFTEAALKFVFADDLMGKRLPIGTRESISSATANAVEAFYERNYVPGQATLIVAGDVDPLVVEREIKAKFAGWSGQIKAEPLPPLLLGQSSKPNELYLERFSTVMNR
jgi:zinc protease